MLTAAVESNMGYYIKQVDGPAIGIFQMEPATHDDIWDNYLAYRRDLSPVVTQFGHGLISLQTSLAYGAAMARVHYLRVPAKLPNANDVEGLATYWKEHYNTLEGKGTVVDAIAKYRKYTNRTTVNDGQ
jgi:hypothetical protein